MHKHFIFILLVIIPALAFPDNCANVLASVGTRVPGDTAWRNVITNSTSPGQFWASSQAREKEIQDTVTGMRETVLDDETTPFIQFFQTETATLKDLLENESDKSPDFEVTGLQGGTLQGTILLPVSGHTGKANALKWAKSDTYNLYLTNSKGVKTQLVKGAKSQDVVTIHEIELPLVKGEKFALTYERSGSLGPSGFPEGRTIYFTLK